MIIHVKDTKFTKQSIKGHIERVPATMFYKPDCHYKCWSLPPISAQST